MGEIRHTVPGEWWRSQALMDIEYERYRQTTTASGGEGWTEGHDDEHTDGSLAQAAAAYALYSSVDSTTRDDQSYRDVVLEDVWPDSWEPRWLKPKDRRSDLVRAGALIVAEIERLDRLRERDEARAERRAEGR